MTSYLACSAVLLVAAVVYGSTGFGFGLVSIPALALVLDPIVVVPLVTAVTVPQSLLLAWVHRPFIRRRLLAPLLLGAIAGIPVGVLLLRTVAATPMKFAVGIVVAVLATLLLLGWSRPIRNRHAATMLTGGCAGVLGAAMALPGPPILLLLTNQGETKEVFRANLIAFFSVTNLLTLAGYAAGGLVDAPLLRLAAALLPIALLGSWLGVLLGRRLDEQTFRAATLALVLVAALGLIAANLPR